MVKKRFFSAFFALVIIMSLSNAAWATDAKIVPYASDYLDGCSVRLRSNDVGSMAVDVTVDAVGVADEVGIIEIYVERKIDNKWKFYKSLDSVDHPEFYDYNSRDYLATIYFDAESGYTYRVTITAYARKGSGSDTLDLTSYTCVCK